MAWLFMVSVRNCRTYLKNDLEPQHANYHIYEVIAFCQCVKLCHPFTCLHIGSVRHYMYFVQGSCQDNVPFNWAGHLCSHKQYSSSWVISRKVHGCSTCVNASFVSHSSFPPTGNHFLNEFHSGLSELWSRLARQGAARQLPHQRNEKM